MWSLVPQSVKYLLSSGWLNMKTEANLLHAKNPEFSQKIYKAFFASSASS